MKKTALIESIQKVKAVASFKKQIIQDDEPYMAINTLNEHNDIAPACDTTAGGTTPVSNSDTKISPWTWVAGGVAVLAGGVAGIANDSNKTLESINHAPAAKNTMQVMANKENSPITLDTKSSDVDVLSPPPNC